ncbi:MAG: stringent starvation protein A [Gammaproteobacteria bacterium]|nr:MAG: stringent starvation protein A [Gammaproteobacteria bacterium]
MTFVTGKRCATILYSDPLCPASHCARIVLAEKGIPFDVVDADTEAHPYQHIPTLVDRDLVLYDLRVIMEYLDERYPHPPLMPVDPVSRAMTRLVVHRMEREWYSLVKDMLDGEGDRAEQARQRFAQGLHDIAPLFHKKAFFVNDGFSLADCCMAPLLWRLDHYGIELSPQAAPLLNYAQRLFDRDAFKSSLSLPEREMQ